MRTREVSLISRQKLVANIVAFFVIIVNVLSMPASLSQILMCIKFINHRVSIVEALSILTPLKQIAGS